MTDKRENSKCSDQLEQAELNGKTLLIISVLYRSKCIS